MCEPTTLAMISVAVAAAGTAASVSAQSAQAADQAKSNAQQQIYINADRQNKQVQAGIAEQVANLTAYQKVDQSSQAARAARATAATAAGEAGVSGISVNDLQNEFYSRQGEYANDVETNRTADINKLQLQMQGINTQADSATNSLRQPVQPSFLDAALRIGGSGLDSYRKFMYVPPTGSDPTSAENDVPTNFNPSAPSTTYDQFGGQ